MSLIEEVKFAVGDQVRLHDHQKEVISPYSDYHLIAVDEIVGTVCYVGRSTVRVEFPGVITVPWQARQLVLISSSNTNSEPAPATSIDSRDVDIAGLRADVERLREALKGLYDLVMEYDLEIEIEDSANELDQPASQFREAYSRVVGVFAAVRCELNETTEEV